MAQKYLKLENMRVYYDRNTGSISMISRDPRLKGNPFRLNLTRQSETTESLYRLLEAQGIIDAELDDLPDEVELPRLPLPRNQLSLEHSKGNDRPTDPRLQFLLGQTFGPLALQIDLNYAPNTLIGGGAGTGKTVLLNSIMEQIVSRPATELRYITAHPPRRFEDFHRDKLRPQDRAVSTIFEALALLDGITVKLQERLSLLTAEGVNSWMDSKASLAPIFLVVDGFSELTTPQGIRSPEGRFEDEAKKAISSWLGDLLREGRAAGIYSFLASQRVDATSLTGEQRANCGRRIAMGWMDANSQAMLFGKVEGYSERLRSSWGRGLLKTYAAEPKVFQAFHTLDS